MSRTLPQMNVMLLGFQVKAMAMMAVLPIALSLSGALFLRMLRYALENRAATDLIRWPRHPRNRTESEEATPFKLQARARKGVGRRGIDLELLRRAAPHWPGF